MSTSPPGRGEVVLVEIPYLDAATTVRRPALVVSDPAVTLDAIVAGITSRIRSPLPATHYLIDPAHPDWQASGLRLPSAIRCDRLFTIHHSSIHRTLGRLSDATMRHVDTCLKTALGIL